MPSTDTRTIEGRVFSVENTTALTGTPSYTYLVEVDGREERVVVEDADALDDCDLLDTILARPRSDQGNPEDAFSGRILVATVREGRNELLARPADISWR